MPTYQYRCKDCGHEFEAQQSFSDDPLTECPECHGTVGKIFSAPGITFKGQGFYKTDHGGGRSPSGGSSSSESTGSSSESSSSSSSESTTSSSTSSSESTTSSSTSGSD